MGKSVPKTGFVERLARLKHASHARWTNKDRTRYFEWDPLHGEFEVYDAQGWHLGAVDENGKLVKHAKKGRRIDV